MDVLRFGVSMERELVEKLDERAARDGYANRSEALRALIRKELVRDAQPEDDREVAGIITLLYPYGRRMAECPVSPFPSLTIASNLQLHLHGDICLKLLVVRGAAPDVHGWARTVTTQRGVLGELKVVATEDVYSVLGAVLGDDSGGRGAVPAGATTGTTETEEETGGASPAGTETRSPAGTEEEEARG